MSHLSLGARPISAHSFFFCGPVRCMCCVASISGHKGPVTFHLGNRRRNVRSRWSRGRRNGKRLTLARTDLPRARREYGVEPQPRWSQPARCSTVAPLEPGVAVKSHPESHRGSRSPPLRAAGGGFTEELWSGANHKGTRAPSACNGTHIGSCRRRTKSRLCPR